MHHQWIVHEITTPATVITHRTAGVLHSRSLPPKSSVLCGLGKNNKGYTKTTPIVEERIIHGAEAPKRGVRLFMSYAGFVSGTWETHRAVTARNFSGMVYMTARGNGQVFGKVYRGHPVSYECCLHCVAA